MPSYKVETDQGTFRVDLDKAPSSPEELKALVTDQLAQMKPPAPAAAPPAQSGGFLDNVGGVLRKAAAVVDPMGEIVTAGMAGEKPQTGVAETIATTAAPMVLPTAGSMVGGAFGGVPGAMLGGAAGEGINQLTGLTQPSPEAVAGAALGSPIGQGFNRVLGAGERALARVLPGGAAATHEISAANLAKLSEQFRNTPKASDLYAIVDKIEGVTMPVTNLRATTSKLLSTEDLAARGFKLDKVGTVAGSLGEIAERGEIPFRQWRENLKRAGDWVRDTRDAGGTEHGAAKATFKALMDDADAALAAGNEAMPAVQALKAATAAAKREFAADEVSGLFNLKDPNAAVTEVLSGNDVVIKVNGAQVLKKLRTSEELQRSLPKGEYEQLLADARQFVKGLPALPPATGANVGSSRKIAQILGSTGVGSGLGLIFGGPIGAAAGSSIGMTTAAVMPAILGKLLTNEAGRKYLFSVLSSTGGVIDRQTAFLLATAATSSDPGRGGAAVTLGPIAQQLFGGNQ